MSKKVDLIGKKFGRLKVLSQGKSHFDGTRKRLTWICKCDCGTVKKFIGESLTCGDSRSCGCLRREMKEIDLTGMRFHKLKVIERAEKRGKSSSLFWKCQCDCGNFHTVSSQHLRLEEVKSCGCYRERTEEEDLILAKEFFYNHIEKTNNCWNWKGSISQGYGVMWYGKKQIKSHRFSYFIRNGELQDDKFICHICDNKKCVNPDHLYQGTREDNTRDAVERKRLVVGEKSNKAKLTEKEVLEILKSKVLGRDLARQYGVSEKTIKSIRDKKSWKHLHRS